MPVHIIDPNCEHRDGTIYQDYDCTLNQTDIKTNKNKFYIMQIIEKNGAGYLFIRYGRVGEQGRLSCAKAGKPEDHVSFFIKQFKSKTGNMWSQRHSFEPKKGKYYLCEMDYDDIDEIKPTDKPDGDAGEKKDIACKLDERVQNFLRLVSDVKEMNKTMIDLDIDTKKMPLGKLSQSQIDKGYALLNKIKMALKDTSISPVDRTEYVTDLSSQYYTLVPYVCNRGSRPPVINSDEMVQKYTETLDELSNLSVAAKIVKDSTSHTSDIHPLDAVYQSVETEIKPVEKGSATWNAIQDYVFNTHAPTHSNYKVELIDIYEIERKGEPENYTKHYPTLDNKQLLWHGTRLTNYISILQKGLLLRPDVIPGTYVTGKMFGYGIYGANSFSKSFNYTGADRHNPTACLFLAEFALGKTSNRTQSDYYISKESLKKEGCDSTWGQGKTTPSGYTTLGDIKVPNGKLVNSNVPGGSLLYDEFIVYDQNQLSLRYIVNVKGIWT